MRETAGPSTTLRSGRDDKFRVCVLSGSNCRVETPPLTLSSRPSVAKWRDLRFAWDVMMKFFVASLFGLCWLGGVAQNAPAKPEVVEHSFILHNFHTESGVVLPE